VAVSVHDVSLQLERSTGRVHEPGFPDERGEFIPAVGVVGQRCAGDGGACSALTGGGVGVFVARVRRVVLDETGARHVSLYGRYRGVGEPRARVPSTSRGGSVVTTRPGRRGPAGIRRGTRCRHHSGRPEVPTPANLRFPTPRSPRHRVRGPRCGSCARGPWPFH
jgi:hypothetical protein